MVEGILALGAWPRGGGYISLGSGKIGQSRSQCTRHQEISTCVYFLKCFCPTGSRLLLHIMTTQMKAQDSWQWNSCVQSSMCGFSPSLSEVFPRAGVGPPLCVCACMSL